MLAKIQENESLGIASGNVMSAASVEISMEELNKQKAELSHEPALHHRWDSGYTPEALKSAHTWDTFPSIFAVAVFTVAEVLSQSRCLSTEEQKKMMLYIYIKKLFSAI